MISNLYPALLFRFLVYNHTKRLTIRWNLGTCCRLKSWTTLVFCLTKPRLLYWHGLTNARALISNYMHSFMCDIITHPCPDFKGGFKWCAVEGMAGMSNYIPPFYMDVITYSCTKTAKKYQTYLFSFTTVTHCMSTRIRTWWYRCFSTTQR